jgi:hypothetical protein
MDVQPLDSTPRPRCTPLAYGAKPKQPTPCCKPHVPPADVARSVQCLLVLHHRCAGVAAGIVNRHGTPTVCCRPGVVWPLDSIFHDVHYVIGVVWAPDSIFHDVHYVICVVWAPDSIFYATFAVRRKREKFADILLLQIRYGPAVLYPLLLHE